MPDGNITPAPPAPPSAERLAGEPITQPGQSQLNKLFQDIILGVIIVMFIGFAGAFIAVGGMIVNYESQRQATFEEMKDQVTAQNAKIDNLSTKIEILLQKK
jgi:hypothetical protein